MKKTASIANIKPVIAAPAMAAATWLVPTPDDPKDAWDVLLAVLALLFPCDEDKLLDDVRVPTEAPGGMDTDPGGLLFDETATGTMTTDWFVGGGGGDEVEEEEGGGLRGKGWELD